MFYWKVLQKVSWKARWKVLWIVLWELSWKLGEHFHDFSEMFVLFVGEKLSENLDEKFGEN